VEEHQRAALAHGDLLVEAGRGQRRPPRRQARLERVGRPQRRAVERRRRRRGACVARIEEEQPLVREQRRHDAGERGGHARARPVVRAQQRQRLVRRGARRQRLRQARQQRLDLGPQRALGHGGARQALVPRGQGQLDGRAVGAHDRRRRDLREVVVLGLQPEERHAAHARLPLQPPGVRHGRRGLVQRVQGPQEQTHLLARHDHGGPPVRQRAQVRVARRRRGEPRILPAQHVEHLRDDARLGRLAHPRLAIARLTEIEREEAARPRVACQERAGE
jgi:hypothetical protein